MKIRNKLLSALLALTVAASASTGFFAAANTPKDCEFTTQALSNYVLGYMSWGVKHMGLDVLQEKFEKSGRALPEVKVAVIDSGLATSNRFIKNRYTDDGYNFIDNNTDITDDQYHGTMVSGIIADGTSSNVKVLPLKVNDESGTGKLSNVSKAIYYAIEHGADVINLSLSADDKNHTVTILDDAISAALEKGIIVIAACGNHSGDANRYYPGNKESVINITAIDSSDKIYEKANKGSSIDFALPGVRVAAPYKRISFISTGTSLAAPHASAAAALLKTWDKSIDQERVMEVFKQYSVDLGAKGYDETFGWGMINLSKFDINAEPPKPTEPTEPTEEPTVPTEEPTIPTEEPTVEPTEPSYTIGDVNGDGRVDVRDVTATQRHLADLPAGAFDVRAADVNGDGGVTIQDVTLLQEFLAEFAGVVLKA